MQSQPPRKPVGFGTIATIVTSLMALAYLYTVRPAEYRSMSELREMHYDAIVLRTLPFNVMVLVVVLVAAFALYRLFARPRVSPQPYRQPYPSHYEPHDSTRHAQAPTPQSAPQSAPPLAMTPEAQPHAGRAPSSARPRPLQMSYPRYDNRALAKALAFCLNGYALVLMLAVLYVFREKEAVERAAFLAFLRDSPEGTLLLGTPFCLIALLFLAWKYRATATLFSVAGPQSVTPAGAVYWYFVPLLWFWKPYEAMRNLFAGFDAGRDGHFVLPLWWGLWWLSVLLPLAFIMVVPEGSSPSLPVILTFFALDGLSCVAAAHLVTQVASGQERTVKSWTEAQRRDDPQPASST